MSEPIVTAEQVRYARFNSCGHSISATPCSKCFADRLNALLAPIVAERERLARLCMIEEFGVMLAEAEIDCGQKHRPQFKRLSATRAELSAAATKVSESQNAAPGKETGK